MEMDDYKRGLYGYQRNIHGNYHEYAKGKSIRELTRGPDTAQGGGGMDGFSLAIIAGIILLPLVITYLVISLFSTTILKIYFKITGNEYKTLSFKEAFGMLFKITALYQIISSIVFIGVSWLLLFFINEILHYVPFIGFNINKVIIVFGFVVQIVSVLLIAKFLRKKLTDFNQFYKSIGYAKSIVMSVVIILTIYGIQFLIIYFLLPDLGIFELMKQYVSS